METILQWKSKGSKAKQLIDNHTVTGVAVVEGCLVVEVGPSTYVA